MQGTTSEGDLEAVAAQFKNYLHQGLLVLCLYLPPLPHLELLPVVRLHQELPGPMYAKVTHAD